MSLSQDQELLINKEFWGEKTVDLGKSGSGKSYGARVLLEEAPSELSIIIIDPQDAYFNLDSLGFDYVHLKQIKDYEKYGSSLSTTGARVVIRTKGLGIEEQQIKVMRILKGYRKAVHKGLQYVIIDEAHKFAPERDNPPSKDELRALFQENRSDGVGCLAISQRPARIDKTILSQADHLMLFRVTSNADKEAIKGYLDNVEDLDVIKKLDKGQCFLVGFGKDEPVTVKVREAVTKHSGNSPTHLKTVNTALYDANRKKLVRGEKRMSEQIAANDAVNGVVPSMDGFMDLASLGAKVTLGVAAAGLIGNTVGSLFSSPVPVVSSRTLVGGAGTILAYAGYKFLDESTLKGFPKGALKYAAAGSAVFTVGSAFWDVIAALNVTPPAPLGFAVATATGAAPLVADNGGADVNTAFA